MPTTSVLFVCLGNICRSPLAEGVFLHLAEERGTAGRFEVDSCGTGGWHAGARPDARSVAVADRHGVRLPGHARKLDPRRDFGFDHIIPMDLANRADLLELGAPADRVRLLRSFDPALAGRCEGDLEVPDPYYGGASGFDEVFAMVRRACAGLHEALDSGVR